MNILKKIFNKKFDSKKIIGLLLPFCLILFLFFYYQNYYFLLIIPLLVFLSLILKNNEGLYLQFVITIFATGTGVYLSSYTNRKEIDNIEKETVKKYIQVSTEELSYEFKKSNDIISLLQDTLMIDKQKLMNISKPMPVAFLKSFDNELYIRNIHIGTMENYLLLNNLVDEYYRNITDKSLDFNSRLYYLKLYRTTIAHLIDINNSEYMYLNGIISEDSLISSLKDFWTKYSAK